MSRTTLRELNVGKYVGVRLDENQKKGLDYFSQPHIWLLLGFLQSPAFSQSLGDYPLKLPVS